MAVFKKGVKTINDCLVLHKDIFSEDIYSQVINSHELQELTESNKTNNRALRKGLYISHVKEVDGETYFHYMRCSSNFDGPTEPFKEVDQRILEKLNFLANQTFDNVAPINHVLLQVYFNHDNKKAKISRHADKTKDMDRNGVIAFFTMYDTYDLTKLPGVTKCGRIPGDFVYDKRQSVLTQMKFRPKESTKGLEEFTVKLFPNSVYFMPLSANRLYTHEILPPPQDSSVIPTRMGYVARCSSTRVVIDRDGNPFIIEGENRVPVRQMTRKDMEELKELYFYENTTHDVIEYGNIYYSMNLGDYKRPSTC